MNNFVFRNPTKILFGKGMEDQVGVESARHGSRVLLHYGSDRVKKSGLLEQTVRHLEAAGLHVELLGGVQPNPRLSLVEEGIGLCRENKLDMILALGGGSVIDSAKAIAVGVPADRPVWDFYTGAASPEAALPVATILTIPAAGSESSNASVISNDDGDLKRGLGSDLIYPVFSILNPEFCYTIPSYHIAAGASDILAHLMERYFTNVHPVELTDQLLEAAMRTLVSVTPRVLQNPEDYDLWSELMLTGQIAHNNSLDVGRTGDWASHQIEHEVSGIYDVIHGAGLAVIFPAWMEYVFKHDIQRFVRWSVEVWGVEQDYFNPERTVRAGIAALRRFSESIGMPLRLSDLEVGDDRLEEMASKATAGNSRTLGNFVKLSQEDVLQIYRLAR
ncbi:iron-containing alcohol dehydrogenase [Spirochaeta dissipatitropha]